MQRIQRQCNDDIQVQRPHSTEGTEGKRESNLVGKVVRKGFLKVGWALKDQQELTGLIGGL